ncbi:MAG: PLP-dependent transferase [Actinomycetota bacterium]
MNGRIDLNSTFQAGGPVGYGRFGNENWSDLERAIASLESGPTLVFSSGMAAIGAVFSLCQLERSSLLRIRDIAG